MMSGALIKTVRPDMSCARTCYVSRQYSSAFIVASWFYWQKLFVVSCPTVHPNLL